MIFPPLPLKLWLGRPVYRTSHFDIKMSVIILSLCKERRKSTEKFLFPLLLTISIIYFPRHVPPLFTTIAHYFSSTIFPLNEPVIPVSLKTTECYRPRFWNAWFPDTDVRVQTVQASTNTVRFSPGEPLSFPFSTDVYRHPDRFEILPQIRFGKIPIG